MNTSPRFALNGFSSLMSSEIKVRSWYVLCFWANVCFGRCYGSIERCHGTIRIMWIELMRTANVIRRRVSRDFRARALRNKTKTLPSSTTSHWHFCHFGFLTVQTSSEAKTICGRLMLMQWIGTLRLHLMNAHLHSDRVAHFIHKRRW